MYHALTLTLDGDLHKAPLGADFSGKVLDIGTGTGIWAIDFADQYPGAEVIGTDLSPIQPAWVPVNCQFQIDDCTNEWTFGDASLDYVHMRWMIGCVTNAGWPALAKQAWRCLKPGGYFEWFDFDAVIETDDGTLPNDAAFAQWTGIFEGAVQKLGMDISFRICHDDTMPGALRAAGFEDVHEHNVKIPLSGWAQDKRLRAVGQYVEAAINQDAEGYITMSASALGWRPNEIAVYAAYLRKELREKKCHIYFKGKNVWARKPLDA
jgi:SAM-dependent methyltransferase